MSVATSWSTRSTNEAEFLALLESIRDDVERRRTTGAPVGHDEHASGVVYEPGIVDERPPAT
jgi:hypothetical protein